MITALRGATLTFRGDPRLCEGGDAVDYREDGLVVLEDGLIRAVGDAAALLPGLPPDAVLRHYRDSLILPGFIDCHTHYPQLEMMGAYGEQLIDWLNTYTFPVEQRFAERAHADAAAAVFVRQLLQNGVTTAAVFATVHPHSVDALLEVAAGFDMRLIAGKVCMDRNAPPALCDTPQRAYDESRALLEKWHGRGRAEYALTPRFAPTSSPAQLEAIGALAAAFPDVPIQSHLAENRAEIEWVRQLFPGHANYTEVYGHYGLLRERAIYGHGVHLTEAELQLLHDSGSAIAHCPTSNFFLGSGVFDLRQARAPARPVRVGLSSDVGAGTSLSPLATLNEAYKAAQAHGHPLSSAEAFYLATRGGAEALGLQRRVGALEAGLEADLVVLDLKATPLLTFRLAHAASLDELLFVLMTIGDDRAVSATWVAGREVWRRPG